MLPGLRSDLSAHPPSVVSSATVRPSKLDRSHPLVTYPSASADPMFSASPLFYLLLPPPPPPVCPPLPSPALLYRIVRRLCRSRPVLSCVAPPRVLLHFTEKEIIRKEEECEVEKESRAACSPLLSCVAITTRVGPIQSRPDLPVVVLHRNKRYLE